jgi:hypothetical protein
MEETGASQGFGASQAEGGDKIEWETSPAAHGRTGEARAALEHRMGGGGGGVGGGCGAAGLLRGPPPSAMRAGIETVLIMHQISVRELAQACPRQHGDHQSSQVVVRVAPVASRLRLHPLHPQQHFVQW